MASIKNLKKDINHTLGDLMNECYLWELENPSAETTNSQAILDEADNAYNNLLDRVNEKTEDKRAHFKSISKDLEAIANELVGKINSL